MKTDLAHRYRNVFGEGLPMFYEHPVELASGEGMVLRSPDGREYLDFYNNIQVVGHSNPRVDRAVSTQLATLNVHLRYLNEGLADYAERLVALHQPHLDALVLTCTGSDANEVAMRTAQIVTGNVGFLHTSTSYHGGSELTSRVSKGGAGVDGGAAAFEFPDLDRPGSPTEADSLEMLARRVDELAGAGGVAALIVCPILANEALPRIPDGFLSSCADLVRSAGGLVILDEVQSGLGRTGSWWAYDDVGVRPDLVTMGKALGNGVAVSGCVGGRSHIEAFRTTTRWDSAFTNTPIQAAAGMAVIDEIERRNLIDSSTTVGDRLERELHMLSTEHEALAGIRREGMFFGIRIADRVDRPRSDRGARRLANDLRDNGILTWVMGGHGDVLKVRPPLVVEWSHCERLLTELEQSVARLDL